MLINTMCEKACGFFCGLSVDIIFSPIFVPISPDPPFFALFRTCPAVAPSELSTFSTLSTFLSPFSHRSAAAKNPILFSRDMCYNSNT